MIDEIPVVWVIPHQAASHTPADVDYRLLATCVEFDVTLVGSLLCKYDSFSTKIFSLYKQAGLLYPPRLSLTCVSDPSSLYCSPENAHFEVINCLK